MRAGTSLKPYGGRRRPETTMIGRAGSLRTLAALSVGGVWLAAFVLALAVLRTASVVKIGGTDADVVGAIGAHGGPAPRTVVAAGALSVCSFGADGQTTCTRHAPGRQNDLARILAPVRDAVVPQGVPPYIPDVPATFVVLAVILILVPVPAAGGMWVLCVPHSCKHAARRAHGLLSLALALAGVLVLAGTALPASAAVPDPVVTGPVPTTTAPGDPAHGYPFLATDYDLAARGYVEEEFFVEGEATRYQADGVTDATRDQWRRTTAQAVPALVWAPAATAKPNGHSR